MIKKFVIKLNSKMYLKMEKLLKFQATNSYNNNNKVLTNTMKNKLHLMLMFFKKLFMFVILFITHY